MAAFFDCSEGPHRLCVEPAKGTKGYELLGGLTPDRGGPVTAGSQQTVFGMTIEWMGEHGNAIAVADLRHYLDDICFYTNRCDHRSANNATFKSITALDQYFQNWGPQRRHRKHKIRKHRH
ncbi:hypothetical protein AAVH_16411 [Aphelenchoides avenae]|nr:hypothetical protein AAVH_16411 [Aphelenchus avenae]